MFTGCEPSDTIRSVVAASATWDCALSETLRVVYDLQHYQPSIPRTLAIRLLLTFSSDRLCPMPATEVRTAPAKASPLTNVSTCAQCVSQEDSAHRARHNLALRRQKWAKRAWHLPAADCSPARTLTAELLC